MTDLAAIVEHMQQPEIKIQNLVVRPWRGTDAEAIYRACQDPAIQRWTPIPRPYEMSHAVGFVANVAGPAWDNRTGAHFGVFDAATGVLLGSMGLVRMDLPAKTAEIGYWTAPGGRGRGVATYAGRAVAAFGFEVLGIERMTWRADVGNHVSRLVALRIGVTMEGTQRGVLTAVDGSGARVDGWIGAMRPGEVMTVTPPWLATGSATARQAGTFSAPKPTLPLAGGGVLRPATDEDIDAITAACRDPEAVRWTTIPPGYQRPDGEVFVRRHAPETWREGRSGTFAIDDGSGYCGGIDLNIAAGDPVVGEIGIQVGPWARGRSLATAATRTLSAWGFEALGLRRIVYRAHVGNAASRAVAEKSGFSYEGIQRAGCVQRGERRDAWVLSLLDTDSAVRRHEVEGSA